MLPVVPQPKAKPGGAPGDAPAYQRPGSGAAEQDPTGCGGYRCHAGEETGPAGTQAPHAGVPQDEGHCGDGDGEVGDGEPVPPAQVRYGGRALPPPPEPRPDRP